MRSGVINASSCMLGGPGQIESNEMKTTDIIKADIIKAGVIKALANERRLRILEWLKNPRAHFPPQVDGDLVKDGVCALLLA